MPKEQLPATYTIGIVVETRSDRGLNANDGHGPGPGPDGERDEGRTRFWRFAKRFVYVIPDEFGETLVRAVKGRSTWALLSHHLVPKFSLNSVRRQRMLSLLGLLLPSTAFGATERARASSMRGRTPLGRK